MTTTDPGHEPSTGQTAQAPPTDTATTVIRRKPWRRLPPWSEAIDEAFPLYADLMRRAIAREARRYRRFGRAHMLWFRVGGFVEILLSVSFPFVIAVLPALVSGDEVTNRVITGISVAIALVGAIRAFYSWNDNWRLYRTQQLALMIVVRRWELRMLDLIAHSTIDPKRAHEETAQAIEDLVMALQHEQDIFFGTVQLPEQLVSPPDGAARGRPPAVE